jgi:hypothetical protein
MKELYKKHAVPPQNALKEIQAGRLKGKSDINPQWRIEALTDMFGLAGDGWFYRVANKEFVTGANGTIAVFVDIELFYKVDGGMSSPVHGSGGSMFVSDERNGLYTNDEAVKMAITDALGVACKHLGIASDVYRGFKITESKYNKTEPQAEPKPYVQKTSSLPKGVTSLSDSMGQFLNTPQVTQAMQETPKEPEFCSGEDLNIILSNIDNLDDTYKKAINQRLAKYNGKIPKKDADKVLVILGLGV